MNKLVRKLTLRYILLQMLFWSLYGICWSFQVLTMTYAGMSNTQAGVVICASLLITTAIQPALSGFIDRSKKIEPWMVAVILMIMAAAVGCAMRFFYSAQWLLSLLYVLLGITIISFDPILSTLCMDLIRRGMPINFGLARGLGSFSYALTVLFMGRLIEEYSPVPGMTLTAVVALCTAAAILWFRPKEEILPPKPPADHGEEAVSTGVFLRTNPKFALLLVGCALLMGSQVFMSMFLNLMVEKVGGTEAAMGAILCLAGLAELPGMMLFMYLRRRGISGKQLFRFCTLFFVPKYVLSYLAGSVETLAMAQLLSLMTAGFYLVMLPYYVAETIDSANQNKGQALISIAGNGVGAALASLFGGTICDLYGVTGGVIFASALSFVGMLSVFYATSGVKKTEVLPQRRKRR